MKNKKTTPHEIYVEPNRHERKFIEKEIPRLKASDNNYDKLSLGFLYDEGCFVPQDKKRASELYLEFLVKERFVIHPLPVNLDKLSATEMPEPSNGPDKEFYKELDMHKTYFSLGWAEEYHLGYHFMHNHKPAPDYDRAAYWLRAFANGEMQDIKGNVGKIYMYYCQRRGIEPHPFSYAYYLEIGYDKYMEYLDSLDKRGLEP